MASKAELEKQVADLTKELELAKAAKSDVLALAGEVEFAASVVPPEVEGLTQEVQELEHKLSESFNREVSLTRERDALTKELAELKAKPTVTIVKGPDLQASVMPSTGNVVFLDGQQFPIVHRNTVKELAQDMKKAYVDENLTAVVITKTGG